MSNSLFPSFQEEIHLPLPSSPNYEEWLFHPENFTIISHEISTNMELSNAARGLLAYLLSLPSTVDIHTDQLVSPKNGIKSIQNSLRELEKAGYYTCKKLHDWENSGKWKWEKRVYSYPVPVLDRTWKPNKRERHQARTVYGDAYQRYTQQIPVHLFRPLSAVYPNLAEEAEGWNPDEIMFDSEEMLKWKCISEHTWETTIEMRLVGYSCPHCSGKNGRGYDISRTGIFYILFEILSGREVIHFGISNFVNIRLASHYKNGFKSPPLAMLPFPNGADAWSLEQALLCEMNIHGTPSCAKRGLSFSGATEAFFLEDMTHEFHYVFQMLTGVALRAV